MGRKKRIEKFLKSVSEAKDVSDSMLMGGASKQHTDATTNGGACINATKAGCDMSTNQGDCKNYAGTCDNSTNYINCTEYEKA